VIPEGGEEAFSLQQPSPDVGEEKSQFTDGEMFNELLSIPHHRLN
jgi:hypothetical protein